MVFSTASASQNGSAQSAFLPTAGRFPRSDRQLPGVFQQWQGVGVIAFLLSCIACCAFSSSSRGSTLSSGRGSPLPVAAPGSRLLVARSEQIYGRNRAQTKLGGNHLLPSQSSFARINCPLYCAARLSELGLTASSAGYVQTKNRTAPSGHRLFKNLLQVRFVNVDNISTDMESLSVVDIFFDMGA